MFNRSCYMRTCQTSITCGWSTCVKAHIHVSWDFSSPDGVIYCMCHGLERVHGRLHECTYSELLSTIKSGCTECSQNSARVRLEYIWMLYMPRIGYMTDCMNTCWVGQAWCCPTPRPWVRPTCGWSNRAAVVYETCRTNGDAAIKCLYACVRVLWARAILKSHAGLMVAGESNVRRMSRSCVSMMSRE